MRECKYTCAEDGISCLGPVLTSYRDVSISAQCYAIVEEDYLAANEDELSLRIGERVAVHSKVLGLMSCTSARTAPH